MAQLRHSLSARVLAPATLLVAATFGLACARPTAKSDAPRPKPAMDSAMLAQCYTPPETTATGHVGCVLRDQGIRMPMLPQEKQLQDKQPQLRPPR